MKTNITERRKEILMLRPAIAYEYFFGLSDSIQIAKKYGINKSTVHKAKNYFTPDQVRNLHGHKEGFLIIDDRCMNEAIRVLRAHEIAFRVASKGSELTETFESELNAKK